MKKKRDKKHVVREYIEAIITALIIALIIRAFVVQAFKIPSGSMIETLLVGDHLLVNKFIYGTHLPFTNKKIFVFRNPDRGDIIVFKYPKDPSRDFIKRIIAKEGDAVEIKDKVVHVNGMSLNEPYVQHVDHSIRKNSWFRLQSCDLEKCGRDNCGPIKVPKDKLFVMGDNRDSSLDSRCWGFVDLKDIKGKALIIDWSWDKEKHWPRFKRTGRLIE